VTQCLNNARIVTPAGVVDGSIAFADGSIGEIQPGGSQIGEDCEGDWLIPGIIDIHTDNLEKHHFPRNYIDWNPVSACIIHDGICISVGVTTVFDSLSIGSFGSSEARKRDNISNLTAALGYATHSQLLNASHFLHWRCETPSAYMAEWLQHFAQDPLTGLFSLMDHTPGQRQYRNIERFLAMWRGEGMSERDIDARLDEQRLRQKTIAPGNRKLVSDLARESGIPLATHDDEDVEHIQEAAALGATLAEFPVTLAAAEAARAADMSIFMGGPNLMRGGSYSGNVPATDLISKGLLDGFASDYVPRSLIECAFALTRAPHYWPIEKAMDTVSGMPARATNLLDRGSLQKGLRADLVRVKLVENNVLIRGVWVGGQRVG